MATISSVIIAILSPVLGSIADQSGARKPWIAFFAVIKIVSLCCLWFAAPGSPIIYPVIFMILASISAEFSIVFNDSMMPRLVSKDEVGRLSNTAWGLGYLGGLYVPEATAEAIRDHLIPIASLATPNRYELAWLSGAALDDNSAVMEAALALGPSRMLVTSAVPMMAGGTGNLYLSGKHALLAEHRVVENPPNGLGDLLAALFLSRLLSGMEDEKALQLATASVFEVLARAVKRGSNELMLASDASSLSTPMAMVQMRHLVHPAQRRKK
jgi:MFS family permease